MQIKYLVKNFSEIKKKISGRNVAWAIYLVPSHGRMIYDGDKTLILKSTKLTKHIGEEMYLCSDFIYGTITLKSPVLLQKDEFEKLKDKHKIIKKEAMLWWKKTDNLYKYEFKFKPFEHVLKYKAPKGFQTFVQSDKLTIIGKETLKMKIEDNTEDSLKKVSVKELIFLHNKTHNAWHTKNNADQNTLLTLHIIIVKEMLLRGYKFNVVDELDEKNVEYIKSYINESNVIEKHKCVICGSDTNLQGTDCCDNHLDVVKKFYIEIVKMKNEKKSILEGMPESTSSNLLITKLLERVLGVGVLEQDSIRKHVESYKMAVYAKALKETTNDIDTEIMDLKYEETIIPATWEMLNIKRGQKERLMTRGYIISVDGKPFVIHYHPLFIGNEIVLYFRKEDLKFAEMFFEKIEKYVKENNHWKYEKIDMYGKFLDIEDISLSDMFLEKNIKQRLEESVFSFFDSKAKYDIAHIPFKRGIIFAGLPGTGKTLAGKIMMKAISNATFIWVTAKDVQALEGRIDYLFKMARELQPSILFIEDVDRVLHGGTLDIMKTQMDGLESNNGILTILSTNFPDELPKTLIDRPGRFDDVIKFLLPNEELRYAILMHYSKRIEVENRDVALKKIAKMSKDLTPAHLKEIIVSAYLHSPDKINLENLKNSISRINEIHYTYKGIDINNIENKT